jgi:hypothetical protein
MHRISSNYPEAVLGDKEIFPQLNSLLKNVSNDAISENVAFYGYYRPSYVPYFFLSNNMSIFYMPIHHSLYKARIDDFTTDFDINQAYKDKEGNLNFDKILNYIRIYGVSRIIMFAKSADIYALGEWMVRGDGKGYFRFLGIKYAMIVGVRNATIAEITTPVFGLADSMMYDDRQNFRVGFLEPDKAEKYRMSTKNSSIIGMEIIQNDRYHYLVRGKIRPGNWVHIKKINDPRISIYDSLGTKLERFESNIHTILTFVTRDSEYLTLHYEPLPIEKIFALISAIGLASLLLTVYIRPEYL